MSLRAETLHYSNFQNQWNHSIVSDVTDVRKHCHDIILIATGFVFLNMAAKRSHSDISLKECEVLQELEEAYIYQELTKISFNTKQLRFLFFFNLSYSVFPLLC